MDNKVKKNIEWDLEEGNCLLEEIKYFLECYKNSSDFRKMLQDSYSSKRENLSEFDIFMLEEIIGYGKRLDMIISSTYIEPSYENNDEILKATAMVCISDIIRQKLGYKDGIVPYSDYDRVYSQLQAELSSIDVNQLKESYIALKKFLNVGYGLPKEWYTNVEISNILDIIDINVDSLDGSMLPEKFTKKMRIPKWLNEILVNPLGFKPLKKQKQKKR